MKITRVEAIALSAPFEKIFGSLDRVPAHLLRPAANQVSTPRLGQATCVIRVHTDEGLIGLGESYGLPAPEISAVIVSKHLARLIVGRDPRETGVLWDRMYSSQRGGGQTGGFMLQAMAGIDIALWDIRARAAGQSIAAALGGRFRDRIPVYASPVPFLPEPERSAEAARE